MYVSRNAPAANGAVGRRPVPNGPPPVYAKKLMGLGVPVPADSNFVEAEWDAPSPKKRGNAAAGFGFRGGAEEKDDRGDRSAQGRDGSGGAGGGASWQAEAKGLGRITGPAPDKNWLTDDFDD
jgi:hypothetical protein